MLKVIACCIVRTGMPGKGLSSDLVLYHAVTELPDLHARASGKVLPVVEPLIAELSSGYPPRNS